MSASDNLEAPDGADANIPVARVASSEVDVAIQGLARKILNCDSLSQIHNVSVRKSLLQQNPGTSKTVLSLICCVA